MKKYIEIIKSASGEVIQRLDITDVSERSADRMESGVNINLNHKEYHTEQNEYESEMPLKPSA